jgi:hypothetical protein
MRADVLSSNWQQSASPRFLALRLKQPRAKTQSSGFQRGEQTRDFGKSRCWQPRSDDPGLRAVPVGDSAERDMT